MAQIRQLRRARPSFANRKLCPKKFIEHFIDKLPDLHGSEYKRAVFYFANGDEGNVSSHFEMPDSRKPGHIKDLYFKYCGHKIKKSEEFEKFVEETVPRKFQDRFSKSEKGIDIEMCCDALKLASAGRIDRIFLLSNDGDFIPFCRSIKEFGANVSIIHLSDLTPPNRDLLTEADSYDVIDYRPLQAVFIPAIEEEAILAEEAATAAPAEVEAKEDMLAEKPDAEPSDLEGVGDNDRPKATGP